MRSTALFAVLATIAVAPAAAAPFGQNNNGVNLPCLDPARFETACRFLPKGACCDAAGGNTATEAIPEATNGEISASQVDTVLSQFNITSINGDQVVSAIKNSKQCNTRPGRQGQNRPQNPKPEGEANPTPTPAETPATPSESNSAPAETPSSSSETPATPSSASEQPPAETPSAEPTSTPPAEESPAPPAAETPSSAAETPAPEPTPAPPATENAAPANGAKGPDVLPFADSNLVIPGNPTDADIEGTSESAKLMLDYHNQFRAMYGAAPVTWDPELARAGRDHANKCQFNHDQVPKGMGNNIHSMAGSGGQFQVTAHSTLDGYAAEFKDFNWDTYDLGSNGGPMVGHFTQMVWKSTTKIGCGWSFNCSPGQLGYQGFDAGKAFMSSCMYSPPGNNPSTARDNVGVYTG